MSPPVRQHGFSGGEISPLLYGRTDLTKYETGLRTCRNLIPMRHGGVTGRPGTMYVGTTLNAGAQVRLIPFIFNETGLGQSYVLEFGNTYIAFYQNGGVVTSMGSPYTIVTPYLQADLQTLQFDQCADVITIVHPNYTPMELKRAGATSWTLTAPTYGKPINSPGGFNAVGGAGSSQAIYMISSVNALGEESSITFNSTKDATAYAPASVTAPVNLSWSTANAAYYKIYVTQAVSGNPGAWGFIGQTSSLFFVDNGITPDYSNSPPIYNNLFQTTANYPTTVGYIQQRRGFANTINNPLGFWMSYPGDFENYNVHSSPIDSDAVIGSIAGSEVNAIQHILELKFMLMLTAGAEIYVQGNGSGVVTPSAINASTQSQYGASPLRPLKVGDVVMFNQSLGSFIRDFSFDFAIDGYRGNDITVFSSHLFEGYQLEDWSFQKIPDSIVWPVRNDGVLLSCTYVREQEILAWAHHDFINGTVENVCAIPENGEYYLYLSIKRVINGSTVRYIERMSQRVWQGPAAAVANGTANAIGDPIDATYLDCFSSYDGRNTTSHTMTLTASGAFQTGSTAYQQQLTLTCSVNYFGGGQTAQIGDSIFLQDALWVSSQGSKGNQTRLIIQAVISGTAATVTSDTGAVPTEFQAAATTNWSRAVKAVSGLGYLQGQKVSIWADRYVVGSPLNYHVDTVYTVPASGILTLDKWYAVIYIGLPMIQDLETLDMETYFGETMIAKRKRAARVALYLQNTRTLFAGTENPDTNLNNTNNQYLFQLNEMVRGTNQVVYDQQPELTTAQDYVITDSRWNYGNRIFIRNVDPTPLTILALSPQAELPAQVPSYAIRV